VLSNFKRELLAATARRLLEDAVRLDPDNAHAWTQLCTLCAHESTLWHLAPSTLERGLRAFPRSLHIQHVLAHFLERRGHPDEAEKIILSLLKSHPHSGRLLHSWGCLLLRKGERLEAAKVFKRGAQVASLKHLQWTPKY
jgi:Tfp pilus assembly protein PilF